MGLHNLSRIADELMAGGLAAETPVALIQQGTVEGQRCLISTLTSVAEEARPRPLRPFIVVVGEVESAHHGLLPATGSRHDADPVLGIGGPIRWFPQPWHQLRQVAGVLAFS